MPARIPGFGSLLPMESAIEYSRAVMPHYALCPWCIVTIADWFLEWHTPQQQNDIYKGQLAMDCPIHDCRRPVTMNKGRVVQAPPELKTVHRSIDLAEKWATDPMFGNYTTLADFLANPGEQPRAQYFRSGYWPQVNV